MNILDVEKHTATCSTSKRLILESHMQVLLKTVSLLGVSSFSAPISVLLQYQHPWGCYSEENKEKVVLLAVTILWKQSCLMSRNELAVRLGWEWGKGWHTSDTNSSFVDPFNSGDEKLGSWKRDSICRGLLVSRLNVEGGEVEWSGVI